MRKETTLHMVQLEVESGTARAQYLTRYYDEIDGQERHVGQAASNKDFTADSDPSGDAQLDAILAVFFGESA